MERSVSEQSVKRAALQHIWGRLALALDGALVARDEARLSPELFNDPWVDGQIKYLQIFEPELGAVWAVAEASRAGVASEQMHSVALNAGRKLLEIHETIKEKTGHTEPVKSI